MQPGLDMDCNFAGRSLGRREVQLAFGLADLDNLEPDLVETDPYHLAGSNQVGYNLALAAAVQAEDQLASGLAVVSFHRLACQSLVLAQVGRTGPMTESSLKCRQHLID